jgi:ribonuclease D
MDKDQQRSDWGNVELTGQQVKYAALDAWAGYSIIEVLFRKYGSVVGQVSR